MLFRREKPKYEYMLESELERAIAILRSSGVDSEEFAKKLSNIERLHEMLKKPNTSMSADAKATIAANLLGILLILRYERLELITTKALGFVSHLRIK